jgi:hypothetical protein
MAIDPTGRREDALDAFLETKLSESFEIETRTETHAIIAHRKALLGRFRSPERYVVSVDGHGRVTMIPPNRGEADPEAHGCENPTRSPRCSTRCVGDFSSR